MASLYRYFDGGFVMTVLRYNGITILYDGVLLDFPCAVAFGIVAAAPELFA